MRSIPIRRDLENTASIYLLIANKIDASCKPISTFVMQPFRSILAYSLVVWAAIQLASPEFTERIAPSAARTFLEKAAADQFAFLSFVSNIGRHHADFHRQGRDRETIELQRRRQEILGLCLGARSRQHRNQ